MLVYFFIAIAATTLGSLTGMGGGVIIKPVLDMIGEYDVSTINLLSAITVFSMSLVSIGQHVFKRTKIDFAVAIPLALGGIAGGTIGKTVFSLVVKQISQKNLITGIQNIILAILILVVFVYMINKEKIKGFEIRGKVCLAFVGIFLGMISSFLGIGGGPINVALLVFLLGYPAKSATVCSLIIILFSQASSLLSTCFSTGFAGKDLSVLPGMIPGAILGGLLGAKLNRKLPEKSMVLMFNATQLLVLCLTIYNIIKNLC